MRGKPLQEEHAFSSKQYIRSLPKPHGVVINARFSCGR